MNELGYSKATSRPRNAFLGIHTNWAIPPTRLLAARHSIQTSTQSMIACRDARASVKPGIGGSLSIDVAVNATGKASKVLVRGMSDDDAVLDFTVRRVAVARPAWVTSSR